MRPPRFVLLCLIGLAFFALAAYSVKPGWYIRMFYPLRYPHTITTHAKNYNLPPELVAAVIMQESGFDPEAKSDAGAVGVMQLTPKTAKGIALRTGGAQFKTADLLNPEISIRYGCWYLDHLNSKFVRDDNFVTTLAAYNAGQGRVQQWVDEDDDHRLQIDEIPYAETREYVRNIKKISRYYRRAYPELQ